MNMLDDTSGQEGVYSLPGNAGNALESVLFPAIEPYRRGTLPVDGLPGTTLA